MSEQADISALEHEVAQQLAQSVRSDKTLSIDDLQRLADDYETLTMMRELPDAAESAHLAIAQLPGVQALGPAETAQLLTRIYQRAIQLAGQK